MTFNQTDTDTLVYFIYSVAEFKEFERRFKFKPQFKYGWFHLKLYQMFQDLSRRCLIQTGVWGIETATQIL